MTVYMAPWSNTGSAINISGPAIQPKVVVVYINLDSGRQAQPSLNKLVVAWASLVPHCSYWHG